MTTLVIAIIIVLIALAGLFYYLCLEPARAAEKWIAALANGEHIPERPFIGLRFWMRPIHRECLAAAKKVEEIMAVTAR